MRYRSRPVEIEAVQFTGDNYGELRGFVGTVKVGDALRQGFIPAEEQITFPEEGIVALVYDKLHHTWVGVKSDQFIIRGMQGEYYPCDPKVFHAKYVLAEYQNDAEPAEWGN